MYVFVCVCVCVCALECCGMAPCSFGHVHCGGSKQQHVNMFCVFCVFWDYMCVLVCVCVCVCALEYCGMTPCSFGHVDCGGSKQQQGGVLACCVLWGCVCLCVCARLSIVE